MSNSGRRRKQISSESSSSRRSSRGLSGPRSSSSSGSKIRPKEVYIGPTKTNQTPPRDSGDSMDYIKSRLNTRSSERTISPLSKAVIYLLIFICVFAGATSITVWRSKNQPDLTWADTTQLPPVKPAPAMISSEAPESSEAYIEPFACRGHADYAINKIEQIFRESSTFRNVRRVENQLQAVAITPLLGFEDDLVLQARYNPDRIEIFSASRVGVGDFGANRKRLESLRDQLRELMVVQ